MNEITLLQRYKRHKKRNNAAGFFSHVSTAIIMSAIEIEKGRTPIIDQRLGMDLYRSFKGGDTFFYKNTK